MTRSNEISKLIYEEFAANIPNLPPRYFQIGVLINNGLIFQVIDKQLPSYYGDYEHFAWDVITLARKDDHIRQLELINSLLTYLSSDTFRNTLLDGKKISISAINSISNPELKQLSPIMESYDLDNQIYKLSLEVILK